MIVMLDTPNDLHLCSRELGCDVEQLLSPPTQRRIQYPEERFAMDNGAFGRFEAKTFLALLNRELPRRQLCRFVTAPDVVGSARRTAEVFPFWADRLAGWPVAYVCQDGQEDIEIPWKSVSAIFIGGSTEWKLGRHAEACVKAGRILGKWVHVGRVNTPGRLEYFENMGADSVDGTGLARYSHMREKCCKNHYEPKLL
jgi:hypothetical protein